MNNELIGIISNEGELKGVIEDNSFNVMVQITESGPKGDKGDTGEQGIQGPKGDKGDSPNIIPATADTIGSVKVGSGLLITEDGTLSVDKSQIHEVPSGGEVNQVMKKMSGTDYDYGWGDSVKIEAYGSTLLIL